MIDFLKTTIGGLLSWMGAVFVFGIVAKLNYYIFITGWNLI